MERLQMVPLVCELSSFEAQLLAARLGAEGMVWELRGGSSVYPVGWVDVLVDSRDLERARELLLSDEVEAAFDEDWSERSFEPPGRWAGFLFGTALIVVTGTFLLVRLLAL
ncbi:MAG: hypothetical protein HYX32_01740 [Actinobacteria bacterium]|nr:hypothetical protein [Actinomycetota bacterium]